MKKNAFLVLSALLCASTAAMAADENVTILDLTKAVTPLEFDATNGSWTGTYDDNQEVIESQCFIFVHGSLSEYSSWWGFTASNSVDNTRPENVYVQQWSNMALGGIELDENNKVVTDEAGTPKVSGEVPYLVGFYADYFAPRPLDIIFNDGKSRRPQGVYVNLTSYPYYCLEYGDAYARAFANGDKFTLTIHGIAPDESEKTVEVTLASYTNGDLSINRGWKYVDLTPLGTVDEIYFTLASTDTGAYGMNTPGYFAMDKLSVLPAEDSGINSVEAKDDAITYCRKTSTLNFGNGGEFAVVVNSAGQIVASTSEPTLNISNLDAGIYVVKAGNSRMKIAKL